MKVRVELPSCYSIMSRVQWRCRERRTGSSCSLQFDRWSIPDSEWAGVVIASVGSVACAVGFIALAIAGSLRLDFAVMNGGVCVVVWGVVGVGYLHRKMEVDDVASKLPREGVLAWCDLATGHVTAVDIHGLAVRVEDPRVLEGTSTVSLDSGIGKVYKAIHWSVLAECAGGTPKAIAVLNIAGRGREDAGSLVVRRWAEANGVAIGKAVFELGRV